MFFSQELGHLEEFEKDNIIQINKDSFVLTEVGKHFSPQVASVFDAYLDRPLYDQNIQISHVHKRINQDSLVTS